MPQPETGQHNHDHFMQVAPDHDGGGGSAGGHVSVAGNASGMVQAAAGPATAVGAMNAPSPAAAAAVVEAASAGEPRERELEGKNRYPGRSSPEHPFGMLGFGLGAIFSGPSTVASAVGGALPMNRPASWESQQQQRQEQLAQATSGGAGASSGSGGERNGGVDQLGPVETAPAAGSPWSGVTAAAGAAAAVAPTNSAAAAAGALAGAGAGAAPAAPTSSTGTGAAAAAAAGDDVVSAEAGGVARPAGSRKRGRDELEIDGGQGSPWLEGHDGGGGLGAEADTAPVPASSKRAKTTKMTMRASTRKKTTESRAKVQPGSLLLAFYSRRKTFLGSDLLERVVGILS